MSTALDILGPHLRSLPDGETGARRNWIISIVESLRHHDALEVRRDGDWSDYDKTPQLRIRKGRHLYGANLDFGHVGAAQDSYPQFQKLTTAKGKGDLSFQQGVPGDFDLAMFTLGPGGALRHRRPFTEATLREIHGVREVSGPETLFQIEVPVELVLLAKAPPRARPRLAKMLSRTITGLAAADHPATTAPAFYEPLAELRLPADVRFAAGFVHEDQGLSEQREIRDLIESRLGRELMMAAACGLGRRDEPTARANLERTAELCAD
jgi:hypothetical protein